MKLVIFYSGHGHPPKAIPTEPEDVLEYGSFMLTYYDLERGLEKKRFNQHAERRNNGSVKQVSDRQSRKSAKRSS